MHKISFSSSKQYNLKTNFLFNFPLPPKRLFATAKVLGGEHNHTTSDFAPIDAHIAAQNDSGFISTDPNNIDQVVSYKEICKVENLELGLKRTKSGVSAGLDGEIKADYTTGKLEKLAAELKSHTFKASPIKKV